MIKELKYYISKETNPYINLAVEKNLLDNIGEHTCILYLWQNDNTVVIGRNQNPWAECRCELLEKDGGFIARRLSGGGAVYHDLGNLNFTFIASAGNLNSDKNNEVIVSACSMANIPCELTGRNDITADGRKFSGNAFYHSKDKSYHHGTLLVSSDKEKLQKYLTPPAQKLESKGVKSVKSRVVNLSEFSESLTTEDMIKYMLKSFEQVFGMTAEFIETIPFEVICQDFKKFQSWDYIYGKTFSFTYSFEERFTWGNINLMLCVEKGVITSVKTYTDAMDISIPQKIEEVLTGCRFTETDISSAINRSVLPSDLIKLIKI